MLIILKEKKMIVFVVSYDDFNYFKKKYNLIYKKMHKQAIIINLKEMILENLLYHYDTDVYERYILSQLIIDRIYNSIISRKKKKKYLFYVLPKRIRTKHSIFLRCALKRQGIFTEKFYAIVKKNFEEFTPVFFRTKFTYTYFI